MAGSFLLCLFALVAGFLTEAAYLRGGIGPSFCRPVPPKKHSVFLTPVRWCTSFRLGWSLPGAGSFYSSSQTHPRDLSTPSNRNISAPRPQHTRADTAIVITLAIGWYGPLIDHSEAASHVGDFVHLLVLVHRSISVQYKLSKGGESIRRDIQVGDDTRSLFSVTIWHKQIGEMAVAGEVILLQNVKITKFGSFIEATTVQCSSLLRLVYPYKSLISKGVDELMKDCRVGKTAIDKLRKVIIWGQRAASVINNIGSQPFERRRQLLRNWKVPEQSESLNFYSLSEVSRLNSYCKVIFNAYVGEIFLPITWRALGESESGKMFVSRRIGKAEDSNIVEDFICSGCQECGSPLDSENRCMFKQNSRPFYCSKSANHFHVMSFIYRPFMLYVWEESEYLPLLVRNKAAELLFGNITADKVAASHRKQMHCQKPVEVLQKENIAKAAGDLLCSPSTEADKSLQVEQMHYSDKKIEFHLIWLVLLKMLVRQGRNTSLKFEVTVNSSLDSESGKFELVSLTSIHQNQIVKLKYAMRRNIKASVMFSI